MSLYKIDRDGNIWEWEYDSSGWRWNGPLIGNPATVVKARSLAGGQLLHRLDEDGSIWQFYWNSHGSDYTWSQIYKDPNTRAIAGGINGSLYQLQGDGRILALTNPFASAAATWQEFGNKKYDNNNPATIAVAVGPALTPDSEDFLCRLDADGSIWMYFGYAPSWPQIDAPGGAIAIAIGAGGLYKLHSDGSIWVWHPPDWVQLSPPSTVRSIAPDPTSPSLYSLGSDGVIAQYRVSGGLPGWWQQVEKDPAALALAVDAGAFVDPTVGVSPSQLYRLNNDGRILSYQPLTVGSPPPLRLDTSSFSPRFDWNWVEIDHNPDTISIMAITLPPSG
jgi:hypothetical protein